MLIKLKTSLSHSPLLIPEPDTYITTLRVCVCTHFVTNLCTIFPAYNSVSFIIIMLIHFGCSNLWNFTKCSNTDLYVYDLLPKYCIPPVSLYIQLVNIQQFSVKRKSIFCSTVLHFAVINSYHIRTRPQYSQEFQHRIQSFYRVAVE